MKKKIKEIIPFYKPIREWPSGERPREKLMKVGAEHLSTAELLAILISSGTEKLSAVELGRELLNKFKNLENLAHASQAQLQEIKGIGVAKALTLQAAFQISRNLQKEIAEKTTHFFKHPAQVAKIFIPRIGHLKQEVFALALLDSSGKFIHSEIITRGTLNASLVHPREVFRIAIYNSAASIILVHNHPSGQLIASQDDLRITQQLVESGKIIEIPVLDHIIVSNTDYVSLREEGHI
jgi:DNA repair protein RadC